MITDSNHACSAKMATCGLQEGLKKILPYFTFDEVPLKGYYNSEP